MTQKGEHTWDLVLDYHRCLNCGYIFESRQKYEYRFRKYQKDLECPRCKHLFTVTKETKPTFGPLIGDPQPAEVDWS